MPANMRISITTLALVIVSYAGLSTLSTPAIADEQVKCYGVSKKCNDQAECTGEDYIIMSRGQCAEMGGHE